MKLAISQDGVKRKMADKPFSLCLDDDTAKMIVRCLSNKLSSGLVYGWVDIYDAPEGISDTAPEPWAAE